MLSFVLPQLRHAALGALFRNSRTGMSCSLTRYEWRSHYEYFPLAKG
ncbi:hypothetical protein [Fischerella sp. PCC 9605]|nr:hypothetical protein [Fischerella sp. PCC 9605]